MASPQVEEGYTRIANELYDAINAFPFSKRQLKIVHVVIRKTYGYGQTSDEISLSQLAAASGLAVPHVSAAVSELVAMNVLSKEGGGRSYSLGVIKDYEAWKVTETVRGYQSGKGVTETVRGYQNSNEKVTETVIKGLPKREPQKKELKERKKDSCANGVANGANESANGAFALFWNDYPNKKNKKKAQAAWLKLTPADQHAAHAALPRLTRSHDWTKDGGRYVPHPTTYLNGARWEDEVTPGDTHAKPLTRRERVEANIAASFARARGCEPTNVIAGEFSREH